MTSTNKILNLNRINFKNRFRVLTYLFKTIFKIKTSQNEKNFYSFYCSLIIPNAFLIKELDNAFIIQIKNNTNSKIKLRKIPSSDILVFSQVFIWDEYLPVVKLYNKNFKNSIDYKLNIIDAGSNIGLTSIYFLEHFNYANVISIEPENENFMMLEHNLNNNNFNISKPIEGGVWNSNKKLKIVNDFRDKSDWAFRVIETEETVGIIQAYTINQLIIDNNFDIIDILKIDIEGSEKEVFTSQNANLEFLKITKLIAIEIHDEFNCREHINKILEDYGFDCIEKGQTTIGINRFLFNN
ncbi:FkbM family methyltransferase [Flavobacterium sp.]|uniref:FkbM family methyltransferase n=1 Tax=Flavobacterium sp. TaxID=239 RepID=UPI00286ADF94|nr:FkbM family methyltransferase [Flavobacterium sp.]